MNQNYLSFLSVLSPQWIKPITLFSLIFLFSSAILAQKPKPPSQKSIDLAKKLQQKYSEDDETFIMVESKDEYRFEVNTAGSDVSVYEDISETIISISELRARIQRAKFYDELSTVKEIQVLDEKGRKMTPEIKDDYYLSEGIFYSDAKLKHFALDFYSLGQQYKVNYKKTFYDIKYFTSVYFNDILPTEKKTIRFIIPRWLNLELKEMNFEGYDIQLNKSYDEKTKADIYAYTAKDVPAFLSEASAQGKSHIYPHILILAKSYTFKGTEKKLFETVGDLYSWYRSLIQLMKNDEAVLKDKVLELTDGKDSDLEKVKAIYYWVQDNIRYIAFEDGIAGFKPDECQAVYKKRYGDCKGMANLTKEMLILAGYDARLTWIGTRRIAYDYSTPNLAVDNHMICTLILDGKQYFLDPTDKYSAFEDYAERLQGRQVLIEDGDNYILSNIPIEKAEDNTRMIINRFKLEDDLLKGSIKRVYEGEGRSYLLYQINYTETDQLDEALKQFITDGDKNKKAYEIKTSDFENRDELFTIDYDIEISNAVSSFGDEIYLEIDHYQELKGFELKDRELAYQLPYKVHLLIDTELELPVGYKVSTLPASIEEKYDGFSASINFTEEGNLIHYKKEIIIDISVVEKEQFGDWNQFITKLKEKYEEQVILTKKS